MLRVLNHNWFRGILVSAALLVPLGYLGLRNSFAEAQMGTPITSGSSVDATIVPSAAPTTVDLSVGSISAADTNVPPANGLSTSSTDTQDPQTTTSNTVDTTATLHSSEDDADLEDTELVEMAADEDSDSGEAIAQDYEEEDTTVSYHDADSDHDQVASSFESTDEDE